MTLEMKILLNYMVHLKNDYYFVEIQSDVKENLFHFHFIHYKSCNERHGTEPQASAVRIQHVAT